jgi:hypothetical protein
MIFHHHDFKLVSDDAVGEMPKENTPEPVYVRGAVLRCACRLWMFKANGIKRPVPATPPKSMDTTPASTTLAARQA